MSNYNQLEPIMTPNVHYHLPQFTIEHKVLGREVVYSRITVYLPASAGYKDGIKFMPPEYFSKKHLLGAPTDINWGLVRKFQGVNFVVRQMEIIASDWTDLLEAEDKQIEAIDAFFQHLISNEQELRDTIPPDRHNFITLPF